MEDGRAPHDGFKQAEAAVLVIKETEERKDRAVLSGPRTIFDKRLTRVQKSALALCRQAGKSKELPPSQHK